ncbi:DUF805 domain-containing protein [Pseudomonas sp. RP23018S]|uniref:DUF805 domain-containing protein n=1 Tax=Pseudomonas sp. RP23018S TaxID=3096037 RepID=UPI002ACA059C|nr:DUF805 domain-containing protein [Pseudomonas sp. RP23018S]MDZ5601333.1 DUF805 domain-containing protein [Pseudomonas sp. RP23018S]
MSCWIRLGLEPTQDLDAIRIAYRTQLPAHHPETNPEGFQALREAYEEALRLAREHDALQVQAPEADTEATPESRHPTLQAFHTLLEEPSLRFDPQAWQGLIAQLDELPLEQLDDVSWQILGSLRECGPISHRCVGLLADRLAWADQLLRMDNPQEVEALLQRLQVPDPFDTGLMRDWPPMLQMEALWYFRTLEYLFQHRPLFEFEQFVAQHTCVAIPNDAALIERLYRQLSLAGIPSQLIHGHWQQRLHETPEDTDLLYLLTRQADALGEHQQALAGWLRLWREQRHPQAERWLFEHCARTRPERLPLLIQALDQQDTPEHWPRDLSDPLIGSPAQNMTTLSRWSEASRLRLEGIAATFIDWRLDGDDELPLLAWLLDEQPDAVLQRLYWYAWTLQRGEAGLLQQVTQAPSSDDPLDGLILERFQQQAWQQLAWLQQSVVAGALNEYCDSDDAALDLPESLLALDVHPACREWLRRVRVYSAPSVLNLNRQFQMRSMFTVPFALVLQGQLAHQGIVLPPMLGGESLWQWHREQLFMLAMLDQPKRWMDLVSAQVTATLHYPADHPFHGLHRQLLLAQNSSAANGLLDWLDYDDPVQNLVAGRLLDLGTALHSSRLPTAAQVFACLQQEPTLLADYPLGYLLLCAVLFHDRSLDGDERSRMRDRMDGMSLRGGWFDALRASLIAGQCTPPKDAEIESQGVNSKLFKQALQALHSLLNDCLPPRMQILQALQKGKDDTEQDPGLRCAIMVLLGWSERMLVNMDKRPREPAWKAWKLNSRLDRKGYGLTLLAIFACKVVPAAMGLFALREAILLLIVPWMVSAVIRRVRDLGYGGMLLAIMLALCVFLPFFTLILLAMPGDKLPNRYGPAPSAPDRFKDGLQAALRRLNGQ